MAEFLLPKQYMALPKEARAKVRAAFGLKRSGPVEVVQNVVVSDGTTAEDCMEVTAERLRGFLGVEEGEFAALWEAAVDRITGTKSYPLPNDFAAVKDVKVDTSTTCSFGCGLPEGHAGTCAHKECGVSHDPSEKCPNIPFCDSCDGKRAHKVYCKNKTKH